MAGRISVITSGSLGDVNPYIALAGGLKKAGYQVRLATHREFAPAVTGREIEFFPIVGSPSKIMESSLSLDWLHEENHTLRYALKFVRLMRPLVAQQLRDIFDACQDSDLVIYSQLAAGALHAAEKLGIPSALVSVLPMGRTRYAPATGAPMLPKWMPGKSIYNWLSHLVAEQLFWLPFRDIANRWRRDELDLPSAPWKSTYAQIAERGGPIIHAYSQHLVPNPPDWPDWIHTTGFLPLEREVEYEPSQTLRNFLDSGPPPVQIGFGSMRFRDVDKMVDLSVSALKKSGKRGILNIPWADDDQFQLPPEVMATKHVPYEWIFPRIETVVHHGGIGTSQIALRAGIPSIIVPFFSEQVFWANCVVSLDAGIKMPPPRRLTADNLSEAIDRVTNSDRMSQNAREIGVKMEVEDGIDNAIKVIEKLL